MQGAGAVAVAPEHTVEIDDLALGIAEDDRRIIRIVIEDPAQGGKLPVYRQRKVALLNIRNGRQPSRG